MAPAANMILRNTVTACAVVLLVNNLSLLIYMDI